jgi:hypothetical protein
MNRTRRKIYEKLQDMGVPVSSNMGDSTILLMSSQYLDEYEPFVFDGRKGVPNPYKPWFSLPLSHPWREFHRKRDHKWADRVLGILGEMKV